MGVAINSVVLTGRLTKDPELRQTAGGTSVCEIRLAVDSREKVNDQWVDRPDFFDVRIWGRAGENVAQYLSRGSACGVSGKLRLEQWEKDGQKHSKVLVVARDVQFLGGKGDGSKREAVPSGDFVVPAGEFSTGGDADFTAGDDDIPF